MISCFLYTFKTILSFKKQLPFYIVLTTSLLLGCAMHYDTKEVQGILTMGHEVRVFRDFYDNREYWIIDKSGILMKKYQEIIGSSLTRYQPVHALLDVVNCTEPQEGFGSEYEGCYEVKEIISLSKNR